MPRRSTPLLLSITLAAAVPARAQTGDAQPIRTAVYGVEDTVEPALNADAGIRATRLTDAQIADAAALAGYDCLVARLSNIAPARAIDAVRAFVQGGGCFVGEWWGAGAALSGVTAPPPGVQPSPYDEAPPSFLGLFGGVVFDRSLVGVGTPIHVTQPHPVLEGMPDPFSEGSGTDFFVEPVPPLDPGLTEIAHFVDGRGPHTAIAVGSTGSARAVLFFFDAGDATWDPLFARLFQNAVKWAATKPGDALAPATTATLAGREGKNGWFVSAVAITLSASDGGGSGVASSDYALDGGPWQPYAGPFTIASEGITAVSFRSTDAAGNVEAARTIELRIDRTPPVVTVTSPSDGAEAALRQPILASWSASDAVSGLASATGTVPSGSAADTGSVGTKTFQIVAEDVAGNVTTVTRTYHVQYVFAGFLRPIVANGTGVHKLGSTIPVRFQLRDYQGATVPDARAALRVAQVSTALLGSVEVDAVAIDLLDSGTAFSYEVASDAYVYNLSTRRTELTTGTWELRAALDDGTTHPVTIGLR